jgi:hypothetical protein
VKATLLSEMHSVVSQTNAKRVKLFLHRGRDRTQARQAVGQPEPAQLLHTDQRRFQNFSEVKTLIENFA